jgi:hypothetical protein
VSELGRTKYKSNAVQELAPFEAIETNEDAIRMRYSDFSRLVAPKICSFAAQRKRPEF